MPPMYSKRILCFPLPKTTDERNQRDENITYLLLTALRSTVEQLPFLAGSIVPFSKDQPWLHDVRPSGAAYLEVKDLSGTLDFSTLRKACFSPTLLDTDQLCPFPESFYIRGGPLDVCRLRAIFIEGGLLLVISIIHTVCDGRGITDVLKVFAEKFREAQASGSTSAVHEGLPKHIFSFARTSLLSGNGLHGAIENHPCWTTSPLASPGSSSSRSALCTIFKITRESLQDLRQIATSLNSASSVSLTIGTAHPPDSLHSHSSYPPAGISTHDAVAALIWRGIMIARHRAGILSKDAVTHFSQAVDYRTRFGLPQPYFGNAIYGIKTGLALSQLANTGKLVANSHNSELQAAAHAIRAEVNGATAEKFRDLLGFVDRTDMNVLTRLSVLEDLSIGSILLVSYFGFEMYDLDFGEALGGQIEAFRLPSRGLVPGMPVILPRLPDGSCEFIVNEQEDVTRFFGEDEIVQKFSCRSS